MGPFPEVEHRSGGCVSETQSKRMQHQEKWTRYVCVALFYHT
jgi:hypothetical protein